MRVLISGGGTGGHVYPALAVAAQLGQAVAAAQPGQRAAAVAPSAADPVQTPDELLWVGSIGGMEQALVERAHIAYAGIDTGKLHGMDPLTALRNVGRMQGGVRQSLQILRQFTPDVCLATGGYVCVPVVVAWAVAVAARAAAVTTFAGVGVLVTITTSGVGDAGATAGAGPATMRSTGVQPWDPAP